jgi:Domain of unknown function (DUF222)
MGSQQSNEIELLERAGESIEALQLLDISAVPSTSIGELTLRLSRALEQLNAVRSELLSRADANHEGAAVGFVTTAAWLSIRTGCTPASAHRAIHQARTLRALPHTQSAWRAGAITQGHVTQLCTTAERVDDFADHEEQFVGFARTMTPRSLHHALAHFEALVCPANEDKKFAHQRSQRRLNVSTMFDGTVKLDGTFDPINGAIIMNAINALAEAMRPNSDAPIWQLRADALAELCAAWVAGDVHGGTERPQLLITCTLDQLAHGIGAELSPAGHVINPASLRRHACDAAIIRVVTNGASDPIDVGRSTRTIPPALRRALIVRDGGCVFPGCDRPHGWCEAHHIIHWLNGGDTNLANTALLCSRHHHQLHQHQWELTRTLDDTWAVTDANGNDLTHHHKRWDPRFNAVVHCATDDDEMPSINLEPQLVLT